MVWFLLVPTQQGSAGTFLARRAVCHATTFPCWCCSTGDQLLPGAGGHLAQGLGHEVREQLETRVVPKYIVSQRWYAGKGAPIQAHASVTTANGKPTWRWLAGVFEVQSKAEQLSTSCRLPSPTRTTDESRWQKLQIGAIARVRRQATVGVLADATSDENFCRSV